MDQFSHDLEKARAQDLRLIILSTIALLVGLLVVGTGSSSLFDEKTPPVGIVTPEGSVRRRSGRSLEWNSFDQEFTAHLRDSIYTPDGVTAQITLKQGQKIDLKPNTLVKMVEMSPEHAQVEIVFGQADGAVQMDAPERFRNIIYTCQRKPMTELPEISGEGLPAPHRKLATIKDNLRLAAFLPMDKIDYYDVKIRRPVNGALIEKSSFWIPFSWTAVPVENATYDLQVSRDRTFVKLLGNRNAKNGQYLLLNQPGKYFARIKVNKEGDETLVSEVIEFTIQKPTALSADAFTTTPKKTTE